MENIQVVDIKTAIMPCVCELKNLTELANIGWVMDFGSECLKPSDRMTSTAIGAVNISPDIKYSFNRKAMPAELREKCSVPSGKSTEASPGFNSQETIDAKKYFCDRTSVPW